MWIFIISIVEVFMKGIIFLVLYEIEISCRIVQYVDDLW